MQDRRSACSGVRQVKCARHELFFDVSSHVADDIIIIIYIIINPLSAAARTVFDRVRSSESWTRMNPARCWSEGALMMLQAGHTSLKGSRAVIMRVDNHLDHDVVLLDSYLEAGKFLHLSPVLLQQSSSFVVAANVKSLMNSGGMNCSGCITYSITPRLSLAVIFRNGIVSSCVHGLLLPYIVNFIFVYVVGIDRCFCRFLCKFYFFARLILWVIVVVFLTSQFMQFRCLSWPFRSHGVSQKFLQHGEFCVR